MALLFSSLRVVLLAAFYSANEWQCVWKGWISDIKYERAL
jgi:hypothetical protein